VSDRTKLLQLASIRHGPMLLERQDFARGLIDVSAQPRHRLFYRLEREGLVSKCSGRQLCDGVFSEGNTTLLPAGLSASWRVGHRFSCFTVGIDAQAFAEFANQHLGEHSRGPAFSLIETPPRLDAAFEHFLDMLSIEASHSNQLPKSVLDTLQGMLQLHLLRRYGSTAAVSDNARIKAQLEAYAEQRLSELITIEDLAESVQMNAGQLSRWMQKNLATLPKRFLTDLRMRHARRMLETTEQSVLDIALTTGFSSHAHFSTSFKEYFGISPSKIRGEQNF
jgi:AraC-like DNA-binding protein